MGAVPVTPISLTPGVLAEAVIDLGAIAHNVAMLRERAGSAQVMAVVKADGYGHGATEVARAALSAGAAELGVATVDEALALRADGITAPILAWLHPPGLDFGPALLGDVEIAVSSERQLEALLDAARRTGRTATVTVKVDTGLNRNGVAPADYPAMLAALKRAVAEEAIRLRALMSHMVYADQPETPSTTFRRNGSRRCWPGRAMRACASRLRTCRTRRRRWLAPIWPSIWCGRGSRCTA